MAMIPRTVQTIAFVAAWGLTWPGVTPADETGKEEKTRTPEIVSLFNGDDLGKWEPIEFNGRGDVHVAFDGSLTLENGTPLTGVVWTGDKKELPKSNYEISLEAKKHYGDDFFCALTFPVKESHATFLCGGWGGVVVGVSSIDGKDASENETSQNITFERNRWYKIRVRVTDARLTGWIDDKEVFDVELKGRSIGLRPGPIEKCAPLGIANFLTRSAYRKIELLRAP